MSRSATRHPAGGHRPACGRSRPSHRRRWRSSSPGRTRGRSTSTRRPWRRRSARPRRSEDRPPPAPPSHRGVGGVGRRRALHPRRLRPLVPGSSDRGGGGHDAPARSVGALVPPVRRLAGHPRGRDARRPARRCGRHREDRHVARAARLRARRVRPDRWRRPGGVRDPERWLREGHGDGDRGCGRPSDRALRTCPDEPPTMRAPASTTRRSGCLAEPLRARMPADTVSRRLRMAGDPKGGAA